MLIMKRAYEACLWSLLRPQAKVCISEIYGNVLQFEYLSSKNLLCVRQTHFTSEESLDFNQTSLILNPQMDFIHKTKLKGFISCIKPQGNSSPKNTFMSKCNFLMVLGNDMTIFITNQIQHSNAQQGLYNTTTCWTGNLYDATLCDYPFLHLHLSIMSARLKN